MNILDLTYVISPDMPVYPGTEGPTLSPANTYEKDGFKETLLSMYSHTGTHMDAPAHMLEDGVTLDALPASQFIGKALVGGDLGGVLGVVGAVLGHYYPLYFGFKGGKGILCGFTAALVLDWRIALAILAVFVIAFAITRYVSLGSVLGAVVFALGFGLLHYDNLYVMIGGIFLGLLAIYMHRSNIVRLCTGKERKTDLFKKEKSE